MFSSRSPLSPLATLPSDLLSKIALCIVSSPNIPTLQDLSPVRSLLLTCRIVHSKLSLKNNPDLYANIWKLMFDLESAKRRLGPRAVVSSSLAAELSLRIQALKNIRCVLRDTHRSSEGINIDCVTLIRLFVMLTENEEKNLPQFLQFVEISSLSSLLCSPVLSSSSPPEISQRPDVALVAALMWLGNQGALYNEDAYRRNTILDLLEPITIRTETRFNRSTCLSQAVHNPDIEFTIEYFGGRCDFKVPSLIPFARLCTVDRYNMLKREVSGSGRTCTPSTTITGTRFDHDMQRYLRPAARAAHSQPYSVTWEGGEHSLSTLMGLWEGSWFMAARIGSTSAMDMCSRPMQCCIRAYISFEAEKSIKFVDGLDDDGSGLDRAWFPKGVILDESPNFLRIFDPKMGAWISYHTCTDITQNDGAVSDMILVGNTVPAHGEKYGEFTFHGRMRRKDGQIALLRKPLDPRMDHIGTWLFHGEIHGGKDLVGDWWATSETKYPDSVNGWFQLSKADT